MVVVPIFKINKYNLMSDNEDLKYFNTYISLYEIDWQMFDKLFKYFGNTFKIF